MKPVLFVLSLAGFTAACGTAPAPPPHAGSPRADVTLARAQTSELSTQFEAGGVVRARVSATVASRLLAPVVDVRVRAGDRVKAGQTLVTLDTRDMQAHAARAAAALAAARQSVRAADAGKLEVDAGLTLATASYDRISGLHARRSATSHELDEATAALAAARARVAGAEARAAEAAAALTAADAASAAAAISASYGVVTAPFAGRVTETFVDPGSMAAPGAPLLVVEDASPLRLEVSLDETRAGRIAEGHRADIALGGAGADAWIEGRVSEVSRLDPSRHSFLVKIDIPASVSTRSGAFGRARFTAGARAAITAPASAVIRRGQMTFVFAVDREGLAHLHPVTTGAAAGDRVELLAGVADGEQVVDHPPAGLADGVRVTPGAGR